MLKQLLLRIEKETCEKREYFCHYLSALIFWMMVLLSKEALSNSSDADAESALEPLTFSRLIIMPDGTYDIAIADISFRLSILNHLRDKNYNVVGMENILFDQDNSRGAILLLGGTVKHLRCQGKASERRCHLAIDWELFDKRLNKVIYRVLTRHQGPLSPNKDHAQQDVHRFVIRALDSLLQRPKFNALLKKKASPETATNQYAAATFRSCARPPSPLPKGLEAVLDATVVIQTPLGIGSGFIISEDGLILTAHHVIEDSSDLKIKTREGGEYSAVVVRSDKTHDLALLSVSQHLPGCLPLNDTAPAIGTELYAVGAPAGEELAFSVTRGVVGGIRTFENQKFIQTDASVNAGNSGGPLVDMSGKAVAVTSWKIAHAEFEGLGFGIPIDASLDALKLTQGETTTVEVTADTHQSVQASRYPIEDTPDPIHSPHSGISLGKEYRRTNEPQFFYNRGRAVWFTLSMVFFFSGVDIIASSYIVYSKDHSKLDKMVYPNTAGWVIAGLGLGSTTLFFITGGLSKKKRENQRSASLEWGMTPQGLLLAGEF